MFIFFESRGIHLYRINYWSLLRNSYALTNIKRNYTQLTSPYNFLKIIPDSIPGVNILEMNRPPVNSLSLEFLTELNIALEKLENDKNCRGVILTSNIPGIFSAGVDISEFLKKEDRLREFWKSFQEFWMRLYGLKIAVVSAISGHALAGGAVIAVSGDHKIMTTGKATIGMPEAILGVAPPYWVIDLFKEVIGFRYTETVMQLAKRYTAEEAHKLGIVDTVVSQAQLMDTARECMNQYLLVPDVSRQLIKTQMRKKKILKLQNCLEEDTQNFVNHILKDSIQKLVSIYLESLRRKS